MPAQKTAPLGDLRYRVSFDRRATVEDVEAGKKPGDWVEQFTRWTGILYMRGGEEVISQRMGGVVPAVLTVLSDSQTRAIEPSWRARELASGAHFNIRAVPPPDGEPISIDLLCDTGKADG